MKMKPHGFTLIELMVTVAIAGILAAIALPNYQSFVLNARMTAQANDFLTALNFVRSEAIKRNTRVTICKSANPNAATPACTTAGNWEQGWLIFSDGSTAAVVDGSDSILKVHPALDGSSVLSSTSTTANYVSYVSNGHSQQASGAMQGGTFKLCNPSPAIAAGKNIALATASGRAQVTATIPTCP